MKTLVLLLSLIFSPLATAGGSTSAEDIKNLLPSTTAIVIAKIVKSRIIAVFDQSGTYVAPNFDKIKERSIYTVIHCADLEISNVLYTAGLDPFDNKKVISITWTDGAINHGDHIQNSDCPHVSNKAQTKVSRIWTLNQKDRRWQVLGDSDPNIAEDLKGVIKNFEVTEHAETLEVIPDE